MLTPFKNRISLFYKTYCYREHFRPKNEWDNYLVQSYCPTIESAEKIYQETIMSR